MRGCVDRLGELAEDGDAADARPLEDLLDLVQRQAVDLEVGLHGGDAVAGAGDLEVHVAERVFQAGDVGKDLVVVTLGPVIRPIATPATGSLIGTPASISARLLPQMLACEVLPLLPSTSETIRIV